MTWLYSLLEPTAIGNRLALLIAGLRWMGILGFALLSGYFVTQDAYLEIDHINTNGLGLDRCNNRSNGLRARALFVAYQHAQIFLGQNPLREIAWTTNQRRG